MGVLSRDELASKRCSPCEGGVLPLSQAEAQEQVRQVEGWSVCHEGQRIRRTWTVRNFQAGIDFFVKVAAVAEAEGHHPDLHLEGYRNVSIELWTHAISGLSENDFIMAAKINEIPIQLKR
jgi:4a-hydroxytetrahydrobiopterin dehydratase